MAKGYGYARRGRRADRGADVAPRTTCSATTQFTEMYAMDFPRDSILMSHMGEGNWALARAGPPGAADQAPARASAGSTTRRRSCSSTRPGPATLATLVSLGGERFRLVVAEGEILDTDELPGARDALRLLPPRLRRARRAWTPGCGSAARTTRC